MDYQISCTGKLPLRPRTQPSQGDSSVLRALSGATRVRFPYGLPDPLASSVSCRVLTGCGPLKTGAEPRTRTQTHELCRGFLEGATLVHVPVQYGHMYFLTESSLAKLPKRAIGGSSSLSGVPGSEDQSGGNRVWDQHGASTCSFGSDTLCPATQMPDPCPSAAHKRRPPHRDKRTG